MVNLQINRSLLKKETEIAKDVISGKIKIGPEMFHKYSRVYLSTNENMNNEVCRKAFMNRKRVLSVTASGDQIINSILYGGEDIIGIDISSFPKYFVALKIAALKTLNKEDYLTYILGDNSTTPLSKKLYEKIRENLEENSRFFWDQIFNTYSEDEIYDSSFFINKKGHHDLMILRNPYLQDGNFDLIKERLNETCVQLFDKELMEVTLSDFGEFDLILLSNVLNYINSFIFALDLEKVYKEFFENLPLTKDGLALAFNFFGGLKKALKDDSFRVHHVSGRLGLVSTYDEIITYHNKTK